jgi:hypothetical protein
MWEEERPMLSRRESEKGGKAELSALLLSGAGYEVERITSDCFYIQIFLPLQIQDYSYAIVYTLVSTHELILPQLPIRPSPGDHGALPHRSLILRIQSALVGWFARHGCEESGQGRVNGGGGRDESGGGRRGGAWPSGEEGRERVVEASC